MKRSKKKLTWVSSLTVDLSLYVKCYYCWYFNETTNAKFTWADTEFFQPLTFQITKVTSRFGNRVDSATCWSFRNTATLRSLAQIQGALARGFENALLWKEFTRRGGGGNSTRFSIRKPAAEAMVAVEARVVAKESQVDRIFHGQLPKAPFTIRALSFPSPRGAGRLNFLLPMVGVLRPALPRSYGKMLWIL